MRSRTRAMGLIEVLVVCVLLICIASFVLPRYLGGKSADGKTYKAPISMAKDVVCQTNLGTVRQSIAAMAAGDPDYQGVYSLRDVRGLDSAMLKCPVGSEAYQWDSGSQKVHCVHSGHEAY